MPTRNEKRNEISMEVFQQKGVKKLQTEDPTNLLENFLTTYWSQV